MIFMTLNVMISDLMIHDFPTLDLHSPISVLLNSENIVYLEIMSLL